MPVKQQRACVYVIGFSRSGPKLFRGQERVEQVDREGRRTSTTAEAGRFYGGSVFGVITGSRGS